MITVDNFTDISDNFERTCEINLRKEAKQKLIKIENLVNTCEYLLALR